MARLVTIDLPFCESASLRGRLVDAGCRLDGPADALLHQHSRSVDVVSANGEEYIIVGGTELGFTEHPRTDEICSAARLKAWSRKYLPPGKMLAPVTPELFVAYCARQRPEDRLGVLNAVMHQVRIEHVPRILQSVCLPFTKEWWLYAAAADSDKRRSLSHQYFFRIVHPSPKERIQIGWADMPRQPRPDDMVVCPRRPTPFGDEVPGLFCGQMAVKSMLGACGEDADVHDLRVDWPLIDRWNKWGRTTNLDIAAILRKHGFDAHARFWSPENLERNLLAAMYAKKMVDVLLKAQRRRHGWHSQVVSGFETYRGVHYWYVTDPHFDEREYVLPHGNTLLTTKDLLRLVPLEHIRFPILAVEAAAPAEKCN